MAIEDKKNIIKNENQKYLEPDYKEKRRPRFRK
jgi:hypothetical protein